MKQSWLILGALAAGAYFMWGRKSAQPAAQIAPPQAPVTLEECLKTRDASTCAALGLKTAGSVASAISDAISSELKGMDGMAYASQGEQLSGVGAYSGLGGTFYAQGY